MNKFLVSNQINDDDDDDDDDIMTFWRKLVYRRGKRVIIRWPTPSVYERMEIGRLSVLCSYLEN